MKKVSSFEEFETLIRNEPVPDFDKEAMICNINGKISCAGRNRPVKRKVIIPVTVLLFLLMTTIAYGDDVFQPIVKTFETVQSTIIKSIRGKASLEYVKVKYDEKPNGEEIYKIYQKFGTVMYKHKMALKGDEVEVFAVTEAYGINKAIQTLKRENWFRDIEELANSTDTKFKVPTGLPEGFSFKEGTVEYLAMDKNLWIVTEELYQKAKREGKEYFSHIGKLSREAERIELKYQSSHGAITVIIDRSWKYFQNIEDDSVHAEVVKIGQLDALHLTYKNSSAFEKYIFRVDSDERALTYTIVYPVGEWYGKDLKPATIDMINSMQ